MKICLPVKSSGCDDICKREKNRNKNKQFATFPQYNDKNLQQSHTFKFKIRININI